MEAHRPPRAAEPERPKRRPADREPLDARWLEREAVRHLARGESTRHRVRETVERRLRQRCARTGEDAEAWVGEIPAVIETLIERGWLDDRRFAEQLVARGRRAGRSRAELEARLAEAGVEALRVDELEPEPHDRRDGPGGAFDAQGGAFDARGGAFDAADAEPDRDPELAAAFALARRRGLGPYRRNAGERAARRLRDLGVLARRGFDEDVALRVIDAEQTPEAEDEAASEAAKEAAQGSADATRRRS